MEKRVNLKDGREVLIREMRPDDAERSLAFFQALPDSDRAYLRREITSPAVIQERIEEMVAGRVIRLVAEHGGRIVADGALEFNFHGWMKHVGEIRLIVGHEYQKCGLGELMALELYSVANRHKLEEIIVEMMGPQEGVQRIFERLGFHKEAVLTGFVKDTKGLKHDLVIMRCPLAVLWDTLEDHMAETDWHQRI